MLQENDVVDYWKRKAASCGERAVGYNESQMSVQDRNYAVRKEFIFSHCPTWMRTLDYGCGIGRYSPEFRDVYIGADITGEFLGIATKNNPGKTYVPLETPMPVHEELIGIEFEMFFTATVLQHCSDELVGKIFGAAGRLMKDTCLFVLYENDFKHAPHIEGRSSSRYADMMSKQREVLSLGSHSHEIHGEKHTLTIMLTRFA